MGLLSLAVLYPAGNLEAVDAYFFGASASTESGLNTYAPVSPRTSFKTVTVVLIIDVRQC